MVYTPPTNVTTSTQMFQWINGTVGNWFFPGALTVVFLIVIIKKMTNPANTFSKAFASASFATMLLCVFARVLNFVSTTFMTIFIIFTAIGAIWMHMENN